MCWTLLRESQPAGVRIDLFRLTGPNREHCCTRHTNTDGRTDEPLLSGERLDSGVYEIVFGASGYFAREGLALVDPPFLGDVVIRFGIAENSGSYHVPLLLSPFGYSTYRGS